MTDIIPRAEADALVAAVMRPRVKPLVWREGYGVSRAASPFGDYVVTNGILTLPLPMRPQRVYESDADAKAAAQADNKSRIMGALEPTPDDARSTLEAMLAEARKEGYREGWRFAYRQSERTGSVPDPDHAAIRAEAEE